MYNLCCISNELKDTHSFKTMTWKQFAKILKEDGEDAALRILGARWLNNVRATHHIIKHCANNGWGYRVSSDLFPCLTHPDFKWLIADVPQCDLIVDEFELIAEFNGILQQKVRLSCHPDQFNVLASDNPESVSKTIKELNYHGWIMDKLGCQRSRQNPINIHINCTKGDPADIAARFMSNLNLCNQSVTSRLVVENEDKGIWNVNNLIQYVYKPYKIPLTFDNLHHECNPSVHCVSDFGDDMAAEICELTWHGVRPIFHYCEAHPDKNNPRAHADMPTNCPPDWPVDWDIELKMKNFAIRRCEEIRKGIKSCISLNTRAT